jgi:putative membrane protein
MPALISGLPEFLLYFATALALVTLYLVAYSLATAHNEFALIRQNVMSAALALGLSLIGFALPLSSAIVHAKRVWDVLIWGLIAIVVQILIYWLVRLIMPNLSQRIASDELAAALFLGAASLAGGIINAASMTY